MHFITGPYLVIDSLLRKLYVSLKCGINTQGIRKCLRDFTQLRCCVGWFFAKKEEMKSLMNWCVQFLPFSNTKPRLGPVKAKVQCGGEI